MDQLIKDYGGFSPAPVQKAEQRLAVLPLVLALGASRAVFGCGLAYLVELSDKTFRSRTGSTALRLRSWRVPGVDQAAARRRAGDRPSVIAALAGEPRPRVCRAADSSGSARRGNAACSVTQPHDLGRQWRKPASRSSVW